MPKHTISKSTIEKSNKQLVNSTSVVMISSGGGLTAKAINFANYNTSKTDTNMKYVIIGDINFHNETSINEDFIDFISKECGNKKVTDDFQVLHLFDKSSFPKSHRRKCGLMFDDGNGEDGEDCEDCEDCEDVEDSRNDMIMVLGKVNGKAGNENKYEFPPPIDNEIYYGTLCLVKVFEINSSEEDCQTNTDIKKKIMLDSIDVKQWEHIYECLFGGFDDCGDGDGNGDSDEDDEDDIYVELPTTKNGYAKDGFVVDDNEWCSGDEHGDGENNYDYDDSDEEFYLSDED